MFWGKTLLAWVCECVCEGGNSATAVVIPHSSSSAWAAQAEPWAEHKGRHATFYIAKYQPDGWKQESFLPQCNPCFIALNKESIEPLLLHNITVSHTPHRQLVVAGQTTPIRTDAGWCDGFNVTQLLLPGTTTASSNTTANSRPR